MEMESNRCVGCKWRTPAKLGGQGIVCFQKDGKCPDWAIKWALNYGKTWWNHTPRPRKSMTDEELLETMRL
jgi:hypothetical protein